jgi:hypothetical protein
MLLSGKKSNFNTRFQQCAANQIFNVNKILQQWESILKSVSAPR